MAKVKALKDVYLGSQGHHVKGEEFDYEGPANKNLEVLDAPEEDDADSEDDGYQAMTRDELKAELTKRGIEFNPNSTSATFCKLLEASDEKEDAA